MGQPRGAPFSGLPSLAALKETIHRRIAQAFGPHGYVVLRQLLYDMGDHEGLISKTDATAVLREQLQLSTEDVSEQALDIYLSQLVTMKKSELKIASLMSSLRPALPQKEKRRVIDAFKALGSQVGSVRLG